MSNPKNLSRAIERAPPPDMPTAPAPRGFWAKAGIVFGVLTSAVALVSGVAYGVVSVYNSVVERGRELQKAEQLATELADLKNAREQLMSAQTQNQQMRGELGRLIADKDVLIRERDALRTQLETQQANLLQLSQQLVASDNCSFVHRQIEAAQQAVDWHQPWITSTTGPDAEYLREHQILLDRLHAYQNQLGQCAGRPIATR